MGSSEPKNKSECLTNGMGDWDSKTHAINPHGGEKKRWQSMASQMTHMMSPIYGTHIWGRKSMQNSKFQIHVRPSRKFSKTLVHVDMLNMKIPLIFFASE